MEHLVKFTSSEGREGQHTAATLDDALRFVERLRNNEEATDVRVFRMHEVPIEFRTYYKVELGAPEAVEESSPPLNPEPLGEAGPKPLVATASATMDNDATDAGGRRLFSRS